MSCPNDCQHDGECQPYPALTPVGKKFAKPASLNAKALSDEEKVKRLLGSLAQVLTIHQDIDDVLQNKELHPHSRIQRIQSLNNKLGKLLKAHLPG